METGLGCTKSLRNGMRSHRHDRASQESHSDNWLQHVSSRIRLLDYSIPKLLDSSLQIPVVDNADDTRINGGLDWIERKTRFLAADEEHLFADAGADGIDGNQRPPGGLTIRCQRLDNQQLEAD